MKKINVCKAKRIILLVISISLLANLFVQNSNLIQGKQNNFSLSSNLNLTSPQDLYIFVGDPIPYNITWIATGTGDGTYEVTLDGNPIPISSGNWSDYVEISVDLNDTVKYNISTYTYTCNVTFSSSSSNYVRNILFEKVEDIIKFDESAEDVVIARIESCSSGNPYLDGPEDFSFQQGTENHEIEWRAPEEPFYYFEIFVEGATNAIRSGSVPDETRTISNADYAYVIFEVGVYLLNEEPEIYTFTCEVTYKDCETGAEIDPPVSDSVSVTLEASTNETYGGISVLIYLTIFGSVRFLRKKNKK